MQVWTSFLTDYCSKAGSRSFWFYFLQLAFIIFFLKSRFKISLKRFVTKAVHIQEHVIFMELQNILSKKNKRMPEGIFTKPTLEKIAQIAIWVYSN